MRNTVRVPPTFEKKKARVWAKNKNAMNKTKKKQKQKQGLSSRPERAEGILIHFFAVFLLTTTWTRYVTVRFGFANSDHVILSRKFNNVQSPLPEVSSPDSRMNFQASLYTF